MRVLLSCCLLLAVPVSHDTSKLMLGMIASTSSIRTVFGVTERGWFERGGDCWVVLPLECDS